MKFTDKQLNKLWNDLMKLEKGLINKQDRDYVSGTLSIIEKEQLKRIEN